MSNELQVKTQDRLSTLLNTTAIKNRFDEMLGKKTAAFLSSIISAVNSNQELKKCDPMSVISSAAMAASMDLPVNASLGFAHIVPYKGSAQFQLGWKGFIQLAMRSGQYKTINLATVFEGQIKNHNQFTGEMDFDASAEGSKVVGFLLYFKLLNGFEKYFYMTKKQCEEHGKRYSAAFKKNWGPWVDDFEAMALKTVAKMGLSRYGVLSIEMQKAFEVDQAEISDGAVKDYPDAIEAESKEAPAAEAPKKSRLAKAVEATETETVPTEDIPI